MSKILVVDKPYSSFSEEIKRIWANIKFSSVDEDVQVIMISSSFPGEGKSFISSNLAATFALNGEKVLLIDCDLRKGRQHKIFSIPGNNKEGFSNFLIDRNWEENFQNYIKATKIKHLYVLPSGPYPSNPSELLASKKCKAILDQMKELFNVIILDCPPVLGLNDALVLSTYADLSLLVVKHKSTKMEDVSKSKKSLENVGTKKISAVLNQIDSKDNPYYSGYYTNEGKK